MLGSCILRYIPPEESYKKAAYQLERSFNKNMEQYGMSIDFSDSSFECFEKKYERVCVKTVPITCTDGSRITCTIYTNGDHYRSLIKWIRFEQTFEKSPFQNVHIEHLLAYVLQEFETFSYNRSDTTTGDYKDEYETYNSALENCKAFLKIYDDEEEMKIASYYDSVEKIILRRSNKLEMKLILEFGALTDACPTLEDENS
jgi:hypothetical protein